MDPSTPPGYAMPYSPGYASGLFPPFSIPSPSAPVIDGSRKTKRPYVRKATNVAPGIVPPTSPPQLAELAFNIHGWALEDGMAGRSTFEVINAYNATMVKGGFEAKIKELQEQHTGDIYRDDLAYTARELDKNLANTDPSVSRYLVVGYTLREDDPIYFNNRTFARYSENELVGEARPAEQHVIHWNECVTPILVVTPVKENTGTSIRLFGLIMPRSGLCQPVLITHERIFYRWEFRASAGARPAQRNKNWNQVIIDKALSMTLKDGKPHEEPAIKRQRSEEPVVKQEDVDTYYLDSRNRSEIEGEVLELKLDLGNLFEPLSEVYKVVQTIQDTSRNAMTCFKVVLNGSETRGILYAIRITRSDRIKSEVEKQLVKVSNSNGFLPEQCSSFERFGDSGYKSYGVELGHDVLNDIKKLWADLEPLTNVTSLMNIKGAINQTQQSISRENMKDVLQALLSALSYQPNMPKPALQERLMEAIYASRTMRRSNVSRADQHANKPLAIDASFLVTLLKDALAIHEWQGKATEQLAKDIPMSYNGGVFEHMIDIRVSQQSAEDVDNTLRWLINHARIRGCGIDDILLWLERLRLRIRQI
ncbi:hypothetical protein H2198_007830 [Neophaeococcomyces mojaviensis]|uniref:Uncharacterized protein n=1 Tax=Neophaeococcomyces mojaviensis TaxID=3383035 RepID=A0ACC2ZZ59_9EURO|nr:hypothetical protein H2198_007830 [Knufia sp. JES_112]